MTRTFRISSLPLHTGHSKLSLKYGTGTGQMFDIVTLSIIINHRPATAVHTKGTRVRIIQRTTFLSSLQHGQQQRTFPVPILAHLAGKNTSRWQYRCLFILSVDIEVVGDLQPRNADTQSDYFVIVSVDKKEVAKSKSKPGIPAPRWEWEEDYTL